MIWRLHINITVYHQYPTLAILAHKHLGIDALLELEMTKFWFSFKAQPPKMQHMHQSLNRCWARIYPKEIKIIICWRNLSPEKPIAIFLTHSWINCGDAVRETTGIADMHNACRFWQIGNDYPFTKSKERGEVVGSLPTHNGNAPFRIREWHMYGTVRVMYPRSFCAGRNDHTTMTAPLPVCSAKLSIVGLS